ncbi:MAG: TOMM precursor leader peptide-binding protein [Micromonosporaceae bacterium]
MKLTLLPALRRLWRAPTTVQLGVDPRRATTLEFTHPHMAKVLDLLDGSRDEAAIATEAAVLGLNKAEAHRLVGALHAKGLVIDSTALTPSDLPESTRLRLESECAALSLRERASQRYPADLLRRRRRAKVLISGRGRLAAPIAALLGAAGVGRMQIQLEGRVSHADVALGGLLLSDLGRPRAVAAADAVRRAAPDTDIRPLHGVEPDLAILVGTPKPAPLTALAHNYRRRPHLTVWLRDGVVVLGPLVRPGETPCLQCLDLHRRNRDPLWPVIAAQLGTYPDDIEHAEAAVVAAGAATAAIHALCHLDGGEPESIGGAVELSPTGRARRRSWPPHPRCGCIARTAHDHLPATATRENLADPDVGDGE